MFHRIMPCWLLVLGVIVIAGCETNTSTVKGNRDFVKDASATVALPNTYDDSEYGFRFSYPENWNEAPFAMGARVLVIGEMESGIAPNVNVVVTPKDDSIFSASKEDFKKTYSMMFQNFKIMDFGTHRFDEKKAIYVHYQGTMGQSNRVEGRQFLFCHEDHNFVVTLTYSPGSFSKYQPIFDSILSSFQFD